MPAPSVETWVLIFYVSFGHPFLGGEYQTRERCEDAAKHQFPHWRIVYSGKLTHRCEPYRNDLSVGK